MGVPCVGVKKKFGLALSLLALLLDAQYWGSRLFSKLFSDGTIRREGLIPHSFMVIGVHGALNIYSDLGERLMNTIDSHIMVDHLYSSNAESVSSTCTSLDMLPCPFFVEPREKRQGDRSSMLLFHSSLGDISDLEPFWTILADGVSWLITQDGVIDGIAEKQGREKQASLSQMMKNEPSSHSRAREKQKSYDGVKSHGRTFFLLKRKFRTIRDFTLGRLNHLLSGSFFESLSSLMDHSNRDEQGSMRFSKLKTILKDAHVAKDKLQELSVVKKSNVTNVGKRKTKRPGFQNHRIQRVTFEDSPDGLLPEFFGSTLGTSLDSHVLLRWVGNWLSFPLPAHRSTMSQRRGLVLSQGSRQHILFSKPVLISEISLIRLNGLVSPEIATNATLTIQGWVWNAKSRQRLAFLGIPQQPETWFFQSEPLNWIRQNGITPLWRLKLSMKDIRDEKPSNVLNRLEATPYVRLDGLTISGGHKDVLVCLTSMTLHRASFKTNKDGGHMNENSSFRPGIILREVGEFHDPPFPLAFPFLKTPGKAWDIQALHKAHRNVWKGQMNYLLQRKRQWNLMSYWDIYSVTPQHVGFHMSELLSRISSDGIFYSWDNRSPMRSLLIFLQRRVPIEAPVVSLQELYAQKKMVRHRPMLGTSAQQHFVYDAVMDTMEKGENVDWNHQLKLNSVFDTMLVKRKLVHAARSAAQTAKRLQNIYNEIGHNKFTGGKKTRSVTKKDGGSDLLVGEEDKEDEDEPADSTTGQDESLSQLFREEFFRSLKEALDKQRQKNLDSEMESWMTSDDTNDNFISLDRHPTPLKEITIAEISDRNLTAVRRYRMNLVTGEIISDGEIHLDETLQRDPVHQEAEEEE